MKNYYLPIAAIMIGGIVYKMTKKQKSSELQAGGDLIVNENINAHEAEDQGVFYSAIIAPSSATAGKPFDIKVKVVNYNAWKTTHTITLSGGFTASKTVLLDPEIFTDVTFNVSFNSAGIYTVNCGDLSATIPIREPITLPDNSNNQQVNGYYAIYSPNDITTVFTAGYYHEWYNEIEAGVTRDDKNFLGGADVSYPAGSDDYNRIVASVNKQYNDALNRWGIGETITAVGVKITVVG